MRLFIACGSSKDMPQKYLDDCKNYINELLKENDLVFGAYHEGLMGLAYDIAKENKRHIIGVCPKVYESDLELIECDTEYVTNLVSERTMELISNSDALIFLPGGIGTMQELFTAIEIKRSGEIDKPIIIYNSLNYFDETLKVLDKIYKEKFADEKVKEVYHVSEDINDTLKHLKNW